MKAMDSQKVNTLLGETLQQQLSLRSTSGKVLFCYVALNI